MDREKLCLYKDCICMSYQSLSPLPRRGAAFKTELADRCSAVISMNSIPCHNSLAIPRRGADHLYCFFRIADFAPVPDQSLCKCTLAFLFCDTDHKGFQLPHPLSLPLRASGVMACTACRAMWADALSIQICCALCFKGCDPLSLQGCGGLPC